MLEELSRTFAMRVGLQITFRCTNGIPVMPTEVALHIYRIAQECFNNIAKHAKASSANLSIEVNEHVFTMIISDNGIGFDPTDAGQRTAGNGIGAGIIRERAELISCVYPARVWFESKPGKGAKTTLEIITAKDASS
jgi:signal transduction histidine kinase